MTHQSNSDEMARTAGSRIGVTHDVLHEHGQFCFADKGLELLP